MHFTYVYSPQIQNPVNKEAEKNSDFPIYFKHCMKMQSFIRIRFWNYIIVLIKLIFHLK